MKSTALIAAAAFTLLMAPDAQAASCSDHVDSGGVHRTARLASSAC